MNVKDTALLVRLSRFLLFLPLWLAAAAILSFTSQWSARAEGPVDGPRAARVPHEVSTVFGAKRSDPYFWLRDDTRSNPQVLEYLKAENAYTDQVLEPLKGLRKAIRDEIASRVPPMDSSVPYLERGYRYYLRFERGQNYPVIARKKEHGDGSERGDGSEHGEGSEEVLLDEPGRAPASGYFSVGSWSVSPDGHLLAWTEDRVGRLQYELHVKDLKTGHILEDTVTGLSANILWGGDSKTILYVVNNNALRPPMAEVACPRYARTSGPGLVRRVRRHVLFDARPHERQEIRVPPRVQHGGFGVALRHGRVRPRISR